METKKAVIEAIDLGFGYSKFTVLGEPNSMPSLAILSSSENIDTEFFKKANVFNVLVDDVEYTVGPEIDKLSTNEIKVLNRNFVESAQYKALCYGCLHMMGHTEIDTLAVGLPNNNFEKMKDVLVKLLEGSHQITKEKEIKVKKVVVLRQPIAGLIQYAQDEEKFTIMMTDRTLRIDAGYFSTDWITCSGLTPIHNLTGASDTGAFSIYKQVMQYLNETVIRELNIDKMESTDYPRIDAALRNNKLRLFGRNIPLDGKIDGKQKFRPVSDIIFQSARQALTECRNNIGENAKSIDAITIGGGSILMYAKAVKEAFPTHEIYIEKDARYSNLLGLLFAANSYAEHKGE